LLLEIKNVLENLVITRTVIDAAKVARNAHKEKKFVSDREYPFAVLLTADGTFSEKEMRITREPAEGGGREERLIRGELTIPLELKIWGKDETQATTALMSCIKNMPSKWSYQNKEGRVMIKSVGFSDHMNNISDKYVCAVIVDFSMCLVSDGEPIPVFNTVQQEEPEIQ